MNRMNLSGLDDEYTRAMRNFKVASAKMVITGEDGTQIEYDMPKVVDFAFGADSDQEECDRWSIDYYSSRTSVYPRRLQFTFDVRRAEDRVYTMTIKLPRTFIPQPAPRRLT